MTTDPTALADRIEAADGPCRELDAEIGVAAAGFITRPNKGWPEETDYGYIDDEGCEVWPGHGGDQIVPAYTASIDAALTLVPEGWQAGFEMGSWHDDPQGLCEAWVWPFESSYDPDWQMGQETQRSNPDGFRATAKTPSLALCAAALRARAAQGGE